VAGRQLFTVEWFSQASPLVAAVVPSFMIDRSTAVSSKAGVQALMPCPTTSTLLFSAPVYSS
jgi:hypothetical protein